MRPCFTRFMAIPLAATGLVAAGLMTAAPSAAQSPGAEPTTRTVDAFEAQARTTAYHGAILIDGTGIPPVSDAVIIVTGSTIVCAGQRTDCAPYLQRQDVRSVDLAGSWIIPGLMDLHFHLPPGEDPDFLPLLAAGVTTVREVGPPASGDTASYAVGHGQIEQMASLAGRIERGELPGPRLRYCGPQLHSSEATYGPNPRFLLLRSDTDVDEVVAYLVERGASCIKMVSGTTADHMREVLTAAAAAGVAGIGHSSHRLPLREQLEWPWAEIHHALWLRVEDLLPAERRTDLPQGEWARLFVGWSRFDADAPEAVALARQVAGRGVGWVPTLGAQPFPWGMDMAIVRLFLAQGAGPDDEALFAAAVFDPAHPPTSAADSLEAMRAVIDRFQKSWTGLLHREGVTILAGSDRDLSDPGALHGELELLVEAGLPPMKALAAATRHAAEALRLGHRIGTIAEGRIADFVVLDADPLEDIRNTRRIRMVIQGGRVVDREALLERESQQVAITDELERERIVAVIAAFARAREELGDRWLIVRWLYVPQPPK
jgi:imidazolonepropionase-like amidohydrolase